MNACEGQAGAADSTPARVSVVPSVFFSFPAFLCILLSGYTSPVFEYRCGQVPVSRLEKDYDKLMAFYDHGYEMMKRELPRLKAYLEK